ncbi:extracellular solute-binding protein [Patescibacteria group bacterium]|nr:extracellular solute-binding protein [Patescibacteria group bacterium]
MVYIGQRLKILLITLIILPILFLSISAESTVKVKLWYPAGEITSLALLFHEKDLFVDFEVENNCKVELIAQDYDFMQQKIFTAIAAGRGVPEILFVDQSWVPGFLKEGALDRVPSADAAKWLATVDPAVRGASDYGNGVMYGYPQYGADIYGLTWNKDYFAEAGFDPERAPTTWAEFLYYSLKTCKEDASGNLIRVGYAIRHLGHPHGVVHKFLWALWGAGADLVTGPKALKGGQAAFNNEGGRAALKLVYDMIYADKSTSLNFPDPRTALLQGLASMQISETISIQTRQPREAPNLKWGMALPPVRYAGMPPATNYNPWVYVVPTVAKNKALAWKAIKWINSVEKDYKFCVKYRMTPRYKVNWEKEPLVSDPYIGALRKMILYGRSYPNNLGLNGIMEALGSAIQEVWHNEAEISPALDEAEILANKAIEDAMR